MNYFPGCIFKTNLPSKDGNSISNMRFLKKWQRDDWTGTLSLKKKRSLKVPQKVVFRLLVKFWISPSIEIPHPWATCSSASPLPQGLIFSLYPIWISTAAVCVHCLLSFHHMPFKTVWTGLVFKSPLRRGIAILSHINPLFCRLSSALSASPHGSHTSPSLSS